ncbi:MAG: hypothetical protein FWC20_11350 [Oscillospiraceae bacterium]|nr:hypothetical protein [Oscillospiraceae bacterium]MCL2279982.1 hypothetical protein [Oscillospiraceae bacterium]
MVTEIKEKEVMTLPELKEKYSTKWFRYIVVGELNYKDPDKEMCYAVITADSEEELYKHPFPDKDKHNGGIDSGYNVPFTPEVGGIYAHA